MRKYVIASVVIVLIVLVSAVVAILAFTLRSRPTVISVEPENIGRLAVGDTFVVNVTVENCVNVYAVQVDLRYDPTVLNATNIVEGPFLPSVRSTLPVINWASNFTDTLPRSAAVYFADSLNGYGNGTDASGNGVLVTITFKVVGGGSTELQLFPHDPTIVNNVFGTYFLDRKENNILPELHNGAYGGWGGVFIVPDKSNFLNTCGELSFLTSFVPDSSVPFVASDLKFRSISVYWSEQKVLSNLPHKLSRR